MKRRRFLEISGLGVLGRLVAPSIARASAPPSLPSHSHAPASAADAYGSGHFGSWIRDAFGLPAYAYTCNQLTDPKAVSPVNKAWRSPTDHTHQVGNDRILAAVSNFGHVQVRQDEGSPKFLNDYHPPQNRYGAGIGFLADEHSLLTTYYSGTAQSFERILGIGYFQKRVRGHQYEIDQVIFAPFGDDPVLISQVTLTNHSQRTVHPRWVEYWGCHNYQFSYRSLMEAAVLGSADATPQLRRDFCSRFSHHFQSVQNGTGLLETQSFPGRSPEEEATWHRMQDALAANPTGYFGGPVPPLAPGASMEDLHPPATFLVSLDAPADGFATHGDRFFQGGIENPFGMKQPLDNDLGSTGPGSALLLERRLTLSPGKSHTMHFLYGYLPEGFRLEQLVEKYSNNITAHWSRSSSHWKADGLHFSTPSEPWVEREAAWSSYYLRSGLTYDSFFRGHILSQGSGTQYVAGLQGAARDPLQHVLPLIFTYPKIVREVILYTLREIQPDGSIPYGIVGSGVPMPCLYRPSDLQLWLLWLASEYILATRDRSFLDQKVPNYPRQKAAPDDPTVLDLLAGSCNHLAVAIGTGRHGLMRLLNGDWNDSVVVNRFPPAEVKAVTQQGESVLNAAMAVYVFSHYARMLDFIGHSEQANHTRSLAESQRSAVRRQWTGRWFRRAWLGDGLGWSGDKQLWLEPQPWAIIGESATPSQLPTLTAALNQLVRKPSPIGALLQNQPDPTMKDPPGVGTNGGIFAAINGTLIWALALVNGSMAWDEWKKNTLARHAEAYPEMWFGIWSGPDAYNSILSSTPGSTGADAPVMNMHAHAWPLYSAAKLLGLEFHPRGLNFRPVLPLPDYQFESPLLGFHKFSGGYSGWYAPAESGQWEIAITLPGDALTKIKTITVNGVPVPVPSGQSAIRFAGEGGSATPLRWEILERSAG